METIPSSSTFRRLPALNRPFRRDKASTPPSNVERERRDDEHSLQPPSRSSSLPTSPNPEPPRSQLEPITYPAHLAQIRPPERQRELTIVPPMDPAEKPDSEARRRRPSRPAVKPVETGHSIRVLQAQLPTTVTTRCPASTMYFSTVPAHGSPPNQPLRAHTGTLVGDRIWLLGGVDGKHCWRRIAWFDTETLLWSTIETFGEQLPPLRAHTTNAVGRHLYIFGGGDGPTYSNDVWLFDTGKLLSCHADYSVSHRFSRPSITQPLPPPRRAHTTIAFKNFLVVFGGGNGQAALNDVWALDVSDHNQLVWQEWPTTGDVPQRKGYHTANLVGDKMVVFGGSDGHASFADVHVLNLSKSVAKLSANDRHPGMDASRYRHQAQSLVAHLDPGRILPIHHRWPQWTNVCARRLAVQPR